ncbi:MAG: polyribonucleotide nucleotidyltransferase [Nitrospinota bacterium]|nr:polyribonucleotide nucleotidyltransferase [Nitrospinota bacterium]
MHQKVERDICGKKLSIEAGELAKQAGGAVIVRLGDTMVLVTATMAKSVREGIDFFPLTVDYREKTYAAGKIPGGFFKREGRPGENETLTCRLIDRPIRPLFPKGFMNETQIICFVISHDSENPSDVISIAGASAALLISDIPFTNPIAGVRVGLSNNEFILNPTHKEARESSLNLIMAGTKEGIVMVEAGSDELDEETMMNGLEFGHGYIKQIIDMQLELQKEHGKEKVVVEDVECDEVFKAKVDETAVPALKEAMKISGKLERQAAIDSDEEALLEQLNAEGNEDVAAAIKNFFHDAEKTVVRDLILQDRQRTDGRGLEDIRPISSRVGYLPRVHGSAIFTRGETQALVSTTLGTGQDEQRLDTLEGQKTKSFMLHYNFPAFCTGEVKFIGSPGRREVGHGMLAERALVPILPSKEKFPYTIRVVSDILESNGSSSMASVCGGTLSLMDAGVPIKAPVAGIAMGLIKEDDQIAILSDILGSEDHLGDMDFKVAGTENGITALQMDIKITGLDKDLMSKALNQAKAGRLHILGEMRKTMDAPRAELSEHAPRIVTMQISTDKIKDVIGPGGKIIRGIIEKTGVAIDINDSGLIAIASNNEAAANEAIEIIENLIQEVEVGKLYLGKVKKIMDFGAFVEILPGTDGLVHISQICDRRINKVTDEISEGDEITVKVIDVDRNGKVKLSRKEALKEKAAGER